MPFFSAGLIIAGLLACEGVAHFASDVPTVISEQRKVEIPREIEPAVRPYFFCLMTETNARVGAVGSVPIDEIPAFHAAVLQACTAVRREAMEQGVILLNDAKMGADFEERRATVEQVLSALETPATPPSFSLKK